MGTTLSPTRPVTQKPKISTCLWSRKIAGVSIYILDAIKADRRVAVELEVQGVDHDRDFDT